jgi:hypothetical protein
MRENGQYKKLGLTWEQFCSQRLGISRAHADRLIRHLEEFGANYFRLAEVMGISPGTYRLIAGSVSDEGIQVDGDTIPIQAASREKIAAAVASARRQSKPPRGAPDVAALRRQLLAFGEGVTAVGQTTSQRVALIRLLEDGRAWMRQLSETVLRHTFILK